MTNHTENFNIKVGDIITFTNKVGGRFSITISRVEEKSWYDKNGGRNSYATLKKYMKYPDFKISR